MIYQNNKLISQTATLDELAKDGFVNTNQDFAGYHIYKNDKMGLLYYAEESKVIVSFSTLQRETE